MATKKKPEAATPAEPTAEETKAQAAFEEYKKRMDGFQARGTRGRDANVGQPLPPPYRPGMPGSHPSGMPGWAFSPPPGVMPQPPAHQFTTPKQPNISLGSGGVLFESLGNMIRLGVDVLNAGLAGGLQIIEGFSGQESCDCDSCRHGSPYHHPHDYSHGHHGYGDCCCNHGDPSCGCNPSVHNCY